MIAARAPVRGAAGPAAGFTKGLLVAATAAWLVAIPAAAFGLEQPVEEVFLGELAFPQDTLELQITLAPDLVARDGDRRLGVPGELELGITDALQLSVGLSGEHDLADAGFRLAGLEVGALYCLLQSDERGLVVSVGLESRLPLGDAERTYGLAPWLSVYRELGPLAANASFSVGLETESLSRQAELEIEAYLDVLLPLAPVTPIASVGYERGEEPVVVTAVGAMVRLHPEVELGLASSLRLGNGPVELAGHLLLTIELELADDEDES